MSLDGEVVAVLDDAKLGFSLGGRTYTVRRGGFLAPLFELQQDGVTLVSAKVAGQVFLMSLLLWRWGAS